MNREGGFTLIELLAAMVAGSLLLIYLGWSVSNVTRLLPVPDHQARTEKLHALAPVLTDMLEQMQPPGPDPSLFSGTRNRLKGVVPPPQSAGPVGPVWIALTAKPSRDGVGLFMAMRPKFESPQPFPAAAGAEQLLIDGYRKIEFDYIAAKDEAEFRLPRLVRILFTEPSGRVRRISIIPRIDADGRCRFDPISLTCRY